LLNVNSNKTQLARLTVHSKHQEINIHSTHSYCSMFWLFTSWT